MCALYVCNLHPECNEATLYHKFSRFGKLLNIHICRDSSSDRSLGYGYVNFLHQPDAERALRVLNYDKVHGKSIHLMWTKHKENGFNMSANLYVKNIHPDIDEKTLHDIFSCYGTILSLKISKDVISHGFYGFVQYEDEESAENAIKSLDGKLMWGRVISVSKYKSRKLRSDEKFNNVYLKNFGFNIKDEDLIKLCEQFGTILSAKVMTDENGDSKGFGFVNFKDSESAMKAVESLNGLLIEKNKKLYAGRAKKKAERQAEVMANLHQKVRAHLG